MGQFAVKQYKGKSDDLNKQDHGDQQGGAEIQIAAVSAGHADNGSHTVDIEKIGDQKQKGLVVLAY